MQEAWGHESVFPTSSQLRLLLVWGPHPESHPFDLASPLSPGKGHYCCLWKSLRGDADPQTWGRDSVEAGAGVPSCCWWSAGVGERIQLLRCPVPDGLLWFMTLVYELGTLEPGPSGSFRSGWNAVEISRP